MAIRDQFRPFQSRLCPVWVYFGSILGLFWVYFRSILGVTHGRFTPSESVTHGRFTPPAGVTHGRFIHQKVRPPSAKLPTYLSYLHATLGLPTPRLDAGIPVVLSVASSDWYLDHHPDFAAVYTVRPCDPDQLDCDAHPDRRKHFLGGSVSQWGETVDQFNLTRVCGLARQPSLSVRTKQSSPLPQLEFQGCS